jgi:hypothetical protein
MLLLQFLCLKKGDFVFVVCALMSEDKEERTSSVYIINTAEQVGRRQQLTKWKLTVQEANRETRKVEGNIVQKAGNAMLW